MPEIQYADYENLIRKLAWKFSNNQQDFEEFFAEGNLEYVKALITYDSEKSCFSTYLYKCLNNRFCKIIEKRNVEMKYSTVRTKLTKDPSIDFEHKINFKKTMKSISKEAQKIIRLIFETPGDIVDTVIYEKEITKYAIRKTLRGQGWPIRKIEKCFAEITTALNSF